MRRCRSAALGSVLGILAVSALAGVPTPALAAVPPSASLTYPLNGERNVDTSRSFTWTSAPGAELYYLYVGTTQGAKDLVDSRATMASSYDVPPLPLGRTLWARIWTEVSGVWLFRDISFQVSISAARLTYPEAGQSNVDAVRDFTWSPAPGAEAYYLWVGTAPGTHDVAASGETTATSYKFYSSFPPGRILYARLYTKSNGAWSTHTDLVFTATTNPAAISCSQDLQAIRTDLATSIQLVRQVVGRGTCQVNIQVAARGPSGTLWGIAGKRLWRSTDDATTWKLAWDSGVRGFAALEQVLQLRSGRVLAVVRDAAGLRHILRSTDTAGTTFSTVPSLDLPVDAWVMASQSWAEMDGAIYVGEYGSSHTATRHLWKSTDDGVSFGVASSFTGVRHIHDVQTDPYVPGRLWLTIGDGKYEAHIGYSDDWGKSFTWISRGSYPQSRAVGLMFTQDDVCWATDTPEVPAELDCWGRSDRRIIHVRTGMEDSYRLSLSSGSVVAVFSAIEPKYGDTDGRLRMVSSTGDNSIWSWTLTPWTHDISVGNGKSIPVAITAPDVNRRLWVAYSNLTGASDHMSDFELQLQP